MSNTKSGPSTFVDPMEPRRLFAVGGFDPTWQYSQAAVDAAAGTHLAVLRIVPGNDARTYLLASGDDLTQGGTATRTYVVALEANGLPDKTFANNGVLATSFLGTDRSDPNDPHPFEQIQADIYTDADDSLYVSGIADHRVMRYRRGYPDTKFGTKRAVRLPKNVSPDFVSDIAGRQLTAQVDTVARTVNVLSISADGVKTLYSESYGPADAKFGPTVDFFKVVLTADGFALVYGEQFYDQTFDTDTNDYNSNAGEMHVRSFGRDGIAGADTVINTGTLAPRGVVLARGDGVRLISNTADAKHSRVIDVAEDGRVRRSFYDLPPATGAYLSAILYLPDGGAVVGGRTVKGERRADYVASYAASGTFDDNFGTRGVLAEPASASRDFVTQVALAGDGAILVGRRGGPSDPTIDVQRVTPSGAPLADLLSAHGRADTHFGIAVVRYAGTGGVAGNTIDAGDLSVFDRLGRVNVKLLNVTPGDDGSVTARYRFDTTTGGTYRFVLSAGQVAADDGATNAARDLGTVTGINDDGPTSGYGRNQPASDGSKAYDVIVGYSSIYGVDIDSVRRASLLVTGPDGVSFRAPVVSTKYADYLVAGDRNVVNARYRVSYDGRDWTPADAGEYGLSLPAGSIKDGRGIANEYNQYFKRLYADPAIDFA